MAFSLDDLQIEIQDLIARIAKLDATYLAGGNNAVERGNKLQSQDDEATKAFWRAEGVQISHVMKRPLSEPVDGGDRHNLAKAVLGLLRRIDALEGEISSLRGEAP